MFVGYLKSLKNMVKNFTRKIYFGRNIGIDIQKLNVLVNKTKVFLGALMEENGEMLGGYKEERELVNRIFERVEEYCGEIIQIVKMVGERYSQYIEKRIMKQKEVTAKEIQEFKQGLLY